MKAPKVGPQSRWPFLRDGSINARSQAGPLGDKVPAKAPAPSAKRAAVLPSRKDVIVGPDGRWSTHGYVPVPVFTRKEPKP